MCLLILTISSLNHGGAAYSEEPVEQPHVVVNEIEINPPGFDTGNEWVELYNPTNKPIDLEGWRISYTHRGPGTEIIATEPTFIEPGGYFVHTYTGLRLTNANPGVVQLIAPDGTVVDQTAPFTVTQGTMRKLGSVFQTAAIHCGRICGSSSLQHQIRLTTDHTGRLL